MSRTTPIVIQLKKRVGPGAAPPPVDDVDERPQANGDEPYDPLGGEHPPPPPPASASPRRQTSRQTSRQRSASSGRSRRSNRDSRLPPGSAVGNFGITTSLLDVAGLADLFRVFHGEVGKFVRAESEKLFLEEAQNQQARRAFLQTNEQLRSFCDEFVPDGSLPKPAVQGSEDGGESLGEDEGSDNGGSEDGHNHDAAQRPARKRRRKASKPRTAQKDGLLDFDNFSNRLVPQLVHTATEDSRAIQDAHELLTTMVQRFFQHNKELEQLTANPSQVAELFKVLCRTLVEEVNAGKTGGEAPAKRGDKAERRDEGNDNRDESREVDHRQVGRTERGRNDGREGDGRQAGRKEGDRDASREGDNRQAGRRENGRDESRDVSEGSARDRGNRRGEQNRDDRRDRHRARDQNDADFDRGNTDRGDRRDRDRVRDRGDADFDRDRADKNRGDDRERRGGDREYNGDRGDGGRGDGGRGDRGDGGRGDGGRGDRGDGGRGDRGDGGRGDGGRGDRGDGGRGDRDRSNHRNRANPGADRDRAGHERGERDRTDYDHGDRQRGDRDRGDRGDRDRGERRGDRIDRGFERDRGGKGVGKRRDYPRDRVDRGDERYRGADRDRSGREDSDRWGDRTRDDRRRGGDRPQRDGSRDGRIEDRGGRGGRDHKDDRGARQKVGGDTKQDNDNSDGDDVDSADLVRGGRDREKDAVDPDKGKQEQCSNNDDKLDDKLDAKESEVKEVGKDLQDVGDSDVGSDGTREDGVKVCGPAEEKGGVIEIDDAASCDRDASPLQRRKGSPGRGRG